MKLRILLLLCFTFFSASYSQVRLQFTTVNQYGNNLYIDNLTLGTQSNIDVAIAGLANIRPDTNYSIGANPFTLAPVAGIVNVGKMDIATAFTVTLTVTPGGYSSTKTVTAIGSGQAQQVVFDNLTITPGTQVALMLTHNLAGDENPGNNTMLQNTLYSAGAQRIILFEEWTSSTCGPCASNNPTVDAFVTAHFDSLVPVKYHMNWPSPGTDPMYAYNSVQANDRRFYYGVNAVPHVIMDGVVNPSYPYSNAPSLPDAYYSRRPEGSPLSLLVTNQRLAGDSIKTTVNMNIISCLKAGNYYLRVQAIERVIHYATAPGTNGEKDFYDVFRKAYPSSLGTPIQLTPGQYEFSFTYKIDTAVWVDSMMYALAFVQNDATREVINAAKSRKNAEKIYVFSAPTETSSKPAAAPEMVSATAAVKSGTVSAPLVNTFHYAMFEGEFPPAGWMLRNPDNGLTFEKFSGANGPAFGGSNAATVQFYNYSSTGRSDTLYSNTYSGLMGSDSITFNYAYAQYQSENDRLIVRASNDGGITYPNLIFDKAGSALATASATTNSFVPSSASQWRRFSYPLAQIVSQQTTAQIGVQPGWNIVSVPLTVTNPSATALFPNATSVFYAYNNGYQAITNVTNGQAFWARFDSTRSYTIQGGLVSAATVPLVSGWNLVGVYNQQANVAALTTTPAGIINSQFYGYSNGYVIPTALAPGKGYWIRTTQTGVLNLNTTAKENPVINCKSSEAKVIITDAAGATSTLLLLQDANACSRYEMPPTPPEGVFDVRFNSGRMAENINALNSLLVSGAVYPLTISTENVTVMLNDAMNSNFVQTTVAPGKPATVSSKAALLQVMSVTSPASFNLYQNNPNPFNPETRIQWQLPVTSHVSIALYDILGRQVANLVNEVQEAGVHTYSLSANKFALSSGVYFYTMKAGSFNQTKKLVLMK